jgi:mersacidin/lichenicidin family type 2 lantibiotic
MKQSKMIRAWRNQDVDKSPNNIDASGNPAGISELDEKLLGSIGGATGVSCEDTRNGGATGTRCRACNK